MLRTLPTTSKCACIISLLLLAGCSPADADEQLSFETFEQNLMLKIDGKMTPVPLEAMDVWLTKNPSRREVFEIHGEGVAIVGAFPRGLRVDYSENWQTLVGKTISISARGGDPRYAKPSIVTVKGVGQFRVIGGTFTVEKVIPGLHGQTPLTGRIELQIRSGRGESSLQGTFAVKAMTWG